MPILYADCEEGLPDSVIQSPKPDEFWCARVHPSEHHIPAVPKNSDAGNTIRFRVALPSDIKNDSLHRY